MNYIYRTIFMFVMLFFLTSCGAAPVISETSADQESKNDEGTWNFEGEVKIGRVVPITGKLKSFGNGTPYIEEKAIEAINQQGGVMIDGKRCALKIYYKDSGSTIVGAEAAAEALVSEGVDVMIASHTADTVMPVSAVCEREGVLCISTDCPASAWLMGGPYTNSWHSFFDNERELLCFLDAWNSVDTNRKIGLMTANDNEGIEISTFVHDFAAVQGYEIVDAGAYYIDEEDFSEYIDAFAEQDCDIIMGVMVSSDFSRFWNQLVASDYRPKMCTIAKACLFEENVESLGVNGDGLITEVWWSGAFPFCSSITGMDSQTLASDYLTQEGQSLNVVPPTVGYKYANIEILYDILKRAGTLNLKTLNQAAKETDLDTIVGHVQFSNDHVSYMSCVTGQWLCDEDGNYNQCIVGNYLQPSVEKTAEIKLLGR